VVPTVSHPLSHPHLLTDFITELVQLIIAHRLSGPKPYGHAILWFSLPTREFDLALYCRTYRSICAIAELSLFRLTSVPYLAVLTSRLFVGK
jgi:hypothetical protein